MRVNRAAAGTLLLCCAGLACFSLAAQTLRTPASGLKPLSSEQASPKADNQLHTTDQSVLPADAAFGFKTLVQSDNSILLSWTIQPGYYLYQNKLAFSDSEARQFTVDLPRATAMVDEFVGESLVYFDSLQLRLPLGRPASKAVGNYSLIVVFQGCAKDRYCYPPQTRTIPLALP